MSNNKAKTWQDWQLTAYVLKELEPEVAAKIRAAAAVDPRLAAEISEIQATVSQVSELYRAESLDIAATTLPAAVDAAVNTLPDSLFAANTGLKATGPKVFVSSGATGEAAARQSRSAWLTTIGLLAMSACLLVAIFYASPMIQTWNVAKLDKVEPVSGQPSVESIESEVAADTAEANVAANPAAVNAVVDSTEFDQLRPAEGALNLEVMPGSKRDGEKEVVAIDEGKQHESGQQSSVILNKNLQSASAVETTSQPGVQELAVQTAPAHQSTALKTAVPVAAPDAPSPQSELLSLEAKVNEAEFSVSDRTRVMMSQAANGLGADETGSRRRGASGAMGGGGMGDGGRIVGGTVAVGGDLGDVYETLSDEVGVANPGNQGGGPPISLARPARPRGGGDYSADKYASIHENEFRQVSNEALSTFSIDVDTASYVKTRQFLLQTHRLPPRNAVRVEDFINYFDYEYTGPKDDAPFHSELAVATCPWQPQHQLVRIALQGKKIDMSERPKANIVFLLDVSGSMDEPNKLPLVKESMRMLIKQLGENDRIAMVVYAGAAGCVLESTRGDQQETILGALDRLSAGGSTNGGQGIQLAYDIARDHFVPGGINRVILCTDGDFNVGTTSTEGLVNLVVENAKSKVFLTVLGYGMGNTNDAMMEQISNKGNGLYGFVDSTREAHRQMVKQLTGNLMTIAKDVKIQVEFNPQKVQSYRLIGYENRVMAARDFNNDKKDAGEIGAGHRVTALYEIVPQGGATDAAEDRPGIEPLRYQRQSPVIANEEKTQASDELLAVKLRYKEPEGDVSKLLVFPLKDKQTAFADADRDFRWSATVAEFAMLLRQSRFVGDSNWNSLLNRANEAAGVAPESARQECLDMMRVAAGLSNLGNR